MKWYHGRLSIFNQGIDTPTDRKGEIMWLDPLSDGCIYDTKDCYHTCRGCEYGINKCDTCDQDIHYGEEHIHEGEQ